MRGEAKASIASLLVDFQFSHYHSLKSFLHCVFQHHGSQSGGNRFQVSISPVLFLAYMSVLCRRPAGLECKLFFS